MAAKESAPVKTKHYISSDKKTSNVQPHTDSSNSQISSNLTPLFDREDHLKGPDVSYNEGSSSEESDYNQASVIFSLDELQTSLTGLRVSVSPEVSAVEHKNSAGLLFPSLIQDDDKVSVSSKEDSDQDNELDLNSPPPESRDDIIIADTKICSGNEAQTDTVVTSDDSLLCHVQSTVHSMAEDVSIHPTSSLTIEDSSLIDVALDDYSNNNKSPTDTSPQVESSHIETSSSVATITQSSPIDTPTGPIDTPTGPIDTPTGADNSSMSGTEQLGETELSISVCSSNPDVHHERPTDYINMSGSMSSSSQTLSEKLKPTQNTFESPGLLYAHPVKKSSKKVVETLEPAEAATEALLAEEKSAVTTSQTSYHVRAKADKRGEIFIDQTQLPSFNYKNLTGIPLFYPPDRGSSTAADELLLDNSVLKDIEKNAKKIAENLDYMLDNLRYSLHAMATCTKLSVSLHKEAINDIHVTVDDSIKMMYAFLAKFEELNSNMKPIEALAAQIKDVSESLKILEKAIK